MDSEPNTPTDVPDSTQKQEIESRIGLKNHAVTIFEVGKLTDESLNSFISELGKVGSQAEGEAKRYFEHAVTLRDAVQFLRRNEKLFPDEECGLGIDLLRCESLYNLDDATATRILQRNYCVLVSVAPLSQEIRSATSCCSPHLGPPIPEVNSIWFKLWLYTRVRCGPPSILLTKRTRVRKFPAILKFT
ncbi:protein FAM91A1-like isoform X5 [Dysidea avara]|uniref:protein FAM91A1-like isoform X5 n=1 Tax=Dysidea avara TaxID=196820 RepID=UPI00332510FF